MSPIEQDIAQERIRQARNASNLALISTAIATGISLLGATLLLIGKVPEGTVTTAGGLATSIHCIRLAKDANDRLDKLLTELNESD
jgi:hypothetical protein